MQTSDIINKFLFQLARYKIGGTNGASVILTVNYQDNLFKITRTSGAPNERFLNEVKSLARDLLRRKHNVNFAQAKPGK